MCFNPRYLQSNWDGSWSETAGEEGWGGISTAFKEQSDILGNPRVCHLRDEETDISFISAMGSLFLIASPLFVFELLPIKLPALILHIKSLPEVQRT